MTPEPTMEQMNLFVQDQPTSEAPAIRLMDGTFPNKHGVFETGYEQLAWRCKKKDWVYLEVEVGQLENGNWITSHTYSSGHGGGGHGLSLTFCQQWPSRGVALKKRLEYLNKDWDRRIDQSISPKTESENIKKMRRWLKGLVDTALIADGES